MPRTATDVVLENNRAFSAMDVDAMLVLYAPDAEVVDHRRASMGSFQGHDELRAFYLSIFHTACELREELTVLAERDGILVAHCELFGRLAAEPTGPEINVPYGLVYELREDVVARLRIADDGEHALELSGLERG